MAFRNFNLKILTTTILFFLRLLSTSESVTNTGTTKIPINVINLDKDMDRLNKVKKELLSSNDIPLQMIQRLSAVYGKELSKEEIRTNTSYLARMLCPKSVIGCYLSHRKCWEKIYNEKYPYQIIFEDDIIIPDKENHNFYKKCQEAIQELQQCEETKDKWDALLLGAFGPVHPNGSSKHHHHRHGPTYINGIVAGGRRKTKQVTEHCYVPHRPFGCHAYILSKRGAKKLLGKAWYVTYHVDSVIWGINELNIYCHNPMLVYQDMTIPSTIGYDTNLTNTKSFWKRRQLLLLESLIIPESWTIDNYSRITIKWALNEPLIQIACCCCCNVLLTIGRTLVGLAIGFVLGICQRQTLPWLLPINIYITLSMFLLLRIMSMPKGTDDILSEDEPTIGSMYARRRKFETT